MATPTKTFSVPLAHALVTHPASVVGADQSATTKISALISMLHSPVEATANTNPGYFVVEVSPEASGDDSWSQVARYDTDPGNPDTEGMDATEASGETVLAVTLTAGFAAGDQIYIQDAGTLANSEWRRVEQIVTDVSIDIVDGLTTGKDSADVLWGQAEIFVHDLNLSNVTRWRIRFVHEGAAGANVHVKAFATTFDSFG